MWTDGEVEANPREAITEVPYLSEDYFKLIQTYPRLAKYFSLGENVIVKWNGVIYRVRP